MRLAWTLAIGAFVLDAPAYAQAASDAYCTTSAECGALKCIDSRCQAPSDAQVALRSVHAGRSFMFGDGEGYGLAIASIDLAAVVTEPLLMLGATSSSGESSTLLGVACFVPVGLAGPVVHAIHGRWGPAIISFFAWTSLAATTFAVGGLLGLRNQDAFQPGSAWAGGLAFGALGAAALTWLDVKMARSVVGVTPTQGGALATASTRW